MSTPRYQHVRFHTLKLDEDFFFGKMRYYKISFFTGRTILDGELVVVMPWTKVRSTRPFGKVVPPLFPLELQTLTGKGPTVAVSERKILCEMSGDRATAMMAQRPPQVVSPGGDRTPETIGGSELTPSA